MLTGDWSNCNADEIIGIQDAFSNILEKASGDVTAQNIADRYWNKVKILAKRKLKQNAVNPTESTFETDFGTDYPNIIPD
ncbi:MAG: hypothetical protein ACE1ZM_08880 [Gammaproteobacteria bacterium]